MYIFHAESHESLLLLSLPFPKNDAELFLRTEPTHAPPVPGPVAGEGADCLVSEPPVAVICLWSMSTAPSLVSLRNNRKKVWGKLSAREGRKQEVLVLSIFEHLRCAPQPRAVGSPAGLCAGGVQDAFLTCRLT